MLTLKQKDYLICMTFWLLTTFLLEYASRQRAEVFAMVLAVNFVSGICMILLKIKISAAENKAWFTDSIPVVLVWMGIMYEALAGW